MGLDMYMSKKTYVKQWSHNKPEEQFNVDVKKGGEPFNKIKPERVSYVVEQVAYWRKFNALHNWFVENCQDGRDECQESYVDRTKLEELLETLLKVKEVYENSPKKKVQVESGWSNGEKSFVEVEVPEDTDTLDELFPTSSGFFFGGTEYDEYYIQEVNETIELIEGLLKEDEDGDYYYQASW
jgi:hypothetical protein